MSHHIAMVKNFTVCRTKWPDRKIRGQTNKRTCARAHGCYQIAVDAFTLRDNSPDGLANDKCVHVNI